MINFKNKKILITGATGGIGKELVKKFVSLEGSVLASGLSDQVASDPLVRRHYLGEGFEL